MKNNLPQPALPMHHEGWVLLPHLRVGDTFMILNNPWGVFGADPEPGTVVTVYKADPVSEDGFQCAVGIRWKGAKAGGHEGSTRAGKASWWPMRQPSDKTISTIGPAPGYAVHVA